MAAAGLLTCHFVISAPPCKAWCCRDFPCFLGYALYAATVAYRAPEPTLNANEVRSAKHGGEMALLRRGSARGVWAHERVSWVCLCTSCSTTCLPHTVGVRRSNWRWGHRSSVAKIICGEAWCGGVQSNWQFSRSVSKLSPLIFCRRLLTFASFGREFRDRMTQFEVKTRLS